MFKTMTNDEKIIRAYMAHKGLKTIEEAQLYVNQDTTKFRDNKYFPYLGRAYHMQILINNFCNGYTLFSNATTSRYTSTSMLHKAHFTFRRVTVPEVPPNIPTHYFSKRRAALIFNPLPELYDFILNLEKKDCLIPCQIVLLGVEIPKQGCINWINRANEELADLACMWKVTNMVRVARAPKCTVLKMEMRGLMELVLGDNR